MKRLLSTLDVSLIVCSCTLLLALGCGSDRGPSTNALVPIVQAQAAPAPGAPIQVAGEAAAPPARRKIIYTSQIDVVVENIASAQQRLTKLIESVREQGGYLSRQELTGASGSHRRGSWTIRIPLAQFDGFVSAVEQLGELERSSRDAHDVTEAYADLAARLRNKQSSEERLISHLSKSAQLKDTLELERELSRVRGEVEQLQGQLNVLKSKSDLATVTVTLLERQGYVPPIKPTFGAQLSRTFDNSWQALVACGQALTLMVVALSPWLAAAVLIAPPAWLIARRISTP